MYDPIFEPVETCLSFRSEVFDGDGSDEDVVRVGQDENPLRHLADDRQFRELDDLAKKGCHGPTDVHPPRLVSPGSDGSSNTGSLLPENFAHQVVDATDSWISKDVQWRLL